MTRGPEMLLAATSSLTRSQSRHHHDTSAIGRNQMSARRSVPIAAVQPLERRVLFALALDPGFGQGGILDDVLNPDPQGFSQDVSLIQLLDNGKVLVGGTAFPGGEPGMRV